MATRPQLTEEEKQARRAKRAQQREERENRIKQALDYRKMGYSYRALAEMLGVSKSQVQRDVEKALKSITREPAQELLALQLDRYDQLLVATFPLAANGDLFAVDRVLQIMRQIERLNGIDQPLNDADHTANTAADAIRNIVLAAQTITKHQNQ